MASIKPSINLFKDKNKNFLDRFIKWALTIGRVVVIVTEAVALSAFLYRFSLDQQLIDLNDKIVQKQALVRLLKNNEDIYRNLQDRLATAAQLTKNGKDTVTIAKDIITFSSSGFTVNNLFISSNQIKIDANVQSVSSLTNFVNTLKNNSMISSVSIDKIENRITSGVIIVSITATTKNEKTKIAQNKQ